MLRTTGQRHWGSAITTLALIGGCFCLAYPMAAHWLDSNHQSAVSEQAASQWGGLSQAELDSLFAKARAYNAQLAALPDSTALNPNRSDPAASAGSGSNTDPSSATTSPTDPMGDSYVVGPGQSARPKPVRSPPAPHPNGAVIGPDQNQTDNNVDHTAQPNASIGPEKSVRPIRYEEVFADWPIFSFLRVEAIDLNGLPIRHGVNADVLEQGLGHLPNTSYPVGGASTHTVVTGHSGLLKHVYFTHLNKLKIGDIFEFVTLGQTLTYRVTTIKVIEPDDVEILRIVPGQDLATLLTCTPIGINTQRLAVTGTRIPPSRIAPVISNASIIPLGLVGFLPLLPLIWFLLWRRGALCEIVIDDPAFDGQPSWVWPDRTPRGRAWVKGRLRRRLRVGDHVNVRFKPDDDSGQQQRYEICRGEVTEIELPDGSTTTDAKAHTALRFEIVGLTNLVPPDGVKARVYQPHHQFRWPGIVVDGNGFHRADRRQILPVTDPIPVGA